MIRWQPFIPWLFPQGELDRFIDNIAPVADAVALEFLKKPIGSNWSRLSNVLRVNVDTFLKGLNSTNRDRVLDEHFRLEKLLEVREKVRAAGLEFYSAENSFRDLGDGPACCGIPQEGIFASKMVWSLNNLLFQSMNSSRITYDDLVSKMPDELKKVSARYFYNVASTAKRAREMRFTTTAEFLKNVWEDKKHPLNPENFFKALRRQDRHGQTVYRYDPYLLEASS